jgi:hypothetical protein
MPLEIKVYIDFFNFSQHTIKSSVNRHSNKSITLFLKKKRTIVEKQNSILLL